MPVTKDTLDQIALSQSEYDLIVQRLGREPNPVELGLFGALWSEHCGYKHSRPILRGFPTSGPRVLFKIGQENAGAVDIGNGLAVVFKVESHNHPSAVEPFQGAATGVGGIVRDVLAMGARPIALLNSLRFGDPSDPRTRRLFNGVVGGISSYGNCIGVPDVGGEIYFAEAYQGNPLVNAMCVGLVRKDEIVRARAGSPGSVLLLVGAETGRDGIHGASGLASRTFEEEREMRPTVQVGNPFMEKVLIESCLEAARLPGVEGVQDLGAAGLTSSTVEVAEKSGLGIELDLTRVHLRESGMTPYEIMLSESQERMLVIVTPGHEEPVEAVFRRWDIPCSRIGRVTRDRVVVRWEHGEKVADLPVDVLTTPPEYRTPSRRPAWQDPVQQLPVVDIPLPDSSPDDVLLKVLASPNVASRRAVYRQYDHQVQTRTVVGPGDGDAAVLRLREAPGTGIALSIDGNGRLVYLDPFNGGAIAVAEACRNLACVGADPVALTDCLNFGNPDRPEVYWQLEQTAAGMTEACRALGVPIVSGNVSMYNETRGEAIYPTPVVGAVGVLPDVTRHAGMGFHQAGDAVLLLGRDRLSGEEADLGGSEYAAAVHDIKRGLPHINLDLETRVQAACRRAVQEGLVASAHDCSDGGLAVALAECCLAGDVGMFGIVHGEGRWDAALFGEGQSRIVVSAPRNRMPELTDLLDEAGVPWLRLGEVGGNHLFLPDLLNASLADMRNAWENGLSKALGRPE